MKAEFKVVYENVSHLKILELSWELKWEQLSTWQDTKYSDGQDCPAVYKKGFASSTGRFVEVGTLSLSFLCTVPYAAWVICKAHLHSLQSQTVAF